MAKQILQAREPFPEPFWVGAFVALTKTLLERAEFLAEPFKEAECDSLLSRDQ